ncbi:nucleotide pyrophosphatase [Rhodanobacter panaciterrae]|uniref:Nucleotide pyrophosphatase n=1 Tax=Rhodanobacter panaciterrae TaxID=490572 RepID=A0ABQ2ZY89_9GAMM|nr:alkaline phosphatase family protein [Rhodanobacter panaciterrae]GGY29585.1 nucleotide pyrophosphatase [Rhodanobacter panaciterrae]
MTIAFRRLPLSPFLLAFALLATLPSVQAASSAAGSKPHRVILFVWDGMRPDAISAEDTPNLLALAQRGSRFEDNHSTYPTFTMANASSFATGAFPGPLGFYGNRFWAPGASGLNAKGVAADFHNPIYTEDYAVLRDLDTHFDHELLELPTLFAAAQKAGLTTAAVGKSGPAFLQDYKQGGVILDENTALPLAFAKELQQAGYALPAHTVNAYSSSQLSLREDNDSPTEQGKLVTLKDGVTSDATAAAETTPAPANAWMMKVYLDVILPQHRPDLSVVWLRNPDTTQHLYGVGSPEFHLALKAQDELLGQLEARLQQLGMAQDTDIIVVSDHGHSNIAGPRDLFPLRQINDGRVTGVDNDWGYSVSGGIRLADQLTRAGFTAFDGFGCMHVPVLSGLRADGSPLQPTRYDDDGHLCGKPGPYTTPSYVVPEQLPKGALVLAPNGGTEYFYQPEHDAALVRRTVRFLQSREYIGAIFVAKRYGNIPGTLPAESVHLENASRGPDIIISYAWDADAVIQGFRGTEYASQANERGEHGSFSPIDVHNTLLAAGPGFQQGFSDPLPSGNVDVAPTIAALLGLPLPKAQGRVLHEALAGTLMRPLTDYHVMPTTLQPKQPATQLDMQRVDGSPLSTTRFDFTVQLKQLSADGKSWIYFDQAGAKRH